jgi:hypothetical protein
MAANHKKHLQQEREQRHKLAAAAAQRQRIKELAARQREVSWACATAACKEMTDRLRLCLLRMGCWGICRMRVV